MKTILITLFILLIFFSNIFIIFQNYKHAAASAIYSKISFSSLSLILLNIPFLIEPYIDLSSIKNSGIFLHLLSVTLFINIVYKALSIKFNTYQNKQSLMLLFLSFLSVLYFVIYYQKYNLTLTDSLFLLILPLGISSLLLAVYSYLHSRSLNLHYFKMIPIIFSLLALSLVTFSQSYELLSTPFIILQMLLMTSLHYIFYLDLKQSFYY